MGAGQPKGMIWSRFFQRKRWDRERASELESYLATETEENIGRGMTPERAKQAARRKLGNPTLVREEIYRLNSLGLIESFWQDLRYALRALGKSPGFAGIVILSLALGIGANTAIFSLIDAVLLKMLPVKNPGQLVQFQSTNPVIGPNDAFSYPAFREFADQHRVFSGVAAFSTFRNLDFEVDGRAGLATAQAVSGNYFSVLGVKAAGGRTIAAEDDTVASNPIAVISYEYWQRRFALDPAVIGKRVVLNNSPFTIVGVTVPGFFGLEPGERIDISLPVSMLAHVRPDWALAGKLGDALRAPYRSWLQIMGRLAPRVTRQQAAAALAPVMHHAMREAAEGSSGLPFDSPQVRRAFLATKLQLTSGGRGLAELRRQFSKPLLVLMSMVALLLVITCANVANLLLARANARRKEIAVRLTIGAGAARLMRQLMAESVVLAVCGGILGLLFAFAASHSLLALLAHSSTPASLDIRPDETVLGFTLFVSLLTALLCGIVPAWRATRLGLTPALLESTRSMGKAGGRSGFARALVILQVAISLVLLTGAALLARSLANLKDFNPGFNKEHVLLFSISPTMIGYRESQLPALYERLLDRMSALPGVRSATFSVHSPLSRYFSFTTPEVEGYTPQTGKELTVVGVELVGPNYFHVLQTPILSGRDIDSGDRSGAPKVAIVNSTMARLYFGNENPLGRRFSMPGYRGDPSYLQIVGVVKDARYHSLRESSTPMAYIPLVQLPESGITFELRTTGNPASVEMAAQRALKSVDSRMPIFGIRSLSEQLDDSLVEERLVASLSSIFGALALALAAVGLYGLMSYAVNRRTGEIGIRLALGAKRGQIAVMVLRETALLIAVGLAVGIPVTLAASRLIASQLYGLKPNDPWTIGSATLILVAIAVLAGYLPARRASRVDPMRALRNE